MALGLGRTVRRGCLALSLLLAALAPAASAESPLYCLQVATEGGVVAFRVEIAATPAAMARGLMGRRQLPATEGMLFVYPSPRHASFWMKNTLIPLDMVFIGADARIGRIAAEAEPLSLEPIPSGMPVRAVLEIGGGEADRLGLAPGDRVRFPTVVDSPPAGRRGAWPGCG